MPQTPFWQPAEARAQLWRTALGLVLIVAAFIAVSLGLVFASEPLFGLPPQLLATPDTPTATAIYFLTFFGFHLGLVFVLPLLHRRGYASLFGPSRLLNGRHFLLGAGATLAVATALYLVMAVEHLVLPVGVSPPVLPNLPAGLWARWLLPAIALIFFQILAEEALFRGYLLQQLRARFRSPLVWAVLPSLAFGILHFDPATYGVVNASAYVVNAATLGALAALVTVRTGNLAAAAGLHFGNNVMLVLIGLQGSLDGFSLFTVALDLKSGYTTYSILTQTAVMGAAFVLWWRWMNRHRPIAKTAPAP